ncbi:hypothetical protein [Deinococcus aquatilis]|nr:hypothetical protein [Deinococcus aquatilis]
MKLNRQFILGWNWPAHCVDDGLTRIRAGTIWGGGIGVFASHL